MFSYVVKRFLLMVPTLVGISLVVWLIMVAAPGRPRGQGQSFGEQDSKMDPEKDAAKGEAEYLFRRQFALDRPVLWNGWTSLEAEAVARAVQAAQAPVAEGGIGAKLRAQERLEDWGEYAVPALVGLLDSVPEGERDGVQYWLRRSAFQRTIPTTDPEIMDANRARAAENAELARIAWSKDASPEQREAGIARWKAWYESRRARWTWSVAERARVGLTDTQFGTYWSNLIRLDLGTSHQYRRPVIDLVFERLPVTVTLAFLSIVIAYLLAVPLGILSATRPGTKADHAMSVGLFLLYSLPSFFVGTVLLRALTKDPLALFPTSGFRDPAASDWNTWARLKDTIWHITLPLVTLTYASLAGLSRYARTGMLDVLRADYVRTARAKGLSEPAVILRHAARNGMMPVVTLLAGFLPALVGGSVVVEFIFNLKGMGLLTLEAITARDYNIVVGETLIVAILTQVGILFSDILYAVMDPRISYR